MGRHQRYLHKNSPRVCACLLCININIKSGTSNAKLLLLLCVVVSLSTPAAIPSERKKGVQADIWA